MIMDIIDFEERNWRKICAGLEEEGLTIDWTNEEFLDAYNKELAAEYEYYSEGGKHDEND